MDVGTLFDRMEALESRLTAVDGRMDSLSSERQVELGPPIDVDEMVAEWEERRRRASSVIIYGLQATMNMDPELDGGARNVRSRLQMQAFG